MNTSASAPQPDWNLLRAFVAVVDAGSLTAAARLTGASQPTLSRQIGELEASFGVVLFERGARGLRLTLAGQALLPALRQMQLAAQALALAAVGQSQQLAGTVRLTASDMTAAYVLPPIIAALRCRQPAIQIELVVSNQVENLLERQADIAVRHARPQQAELVARRVGDAAIGCFAHRDYLARVGGAVDPARIADYDWIGYDRSDLLLRGFRQAGMAVPREFFAVRCDSHVSGWQMALAGAGIGFAPTLVAARWPEMLPVLPQVIMPSMPVWVTAHRELRQSARIRLVFDALADGLQTMVVASGLGL